MASHPFRRALLIPSMVCALVGLTPMAHAGEAREISAAPYQDQLSGRSVSFLAWDLETGHQFILEGSERHQQHSPHSTFKIANLLIALESGVSKSLEDRRSWDPQKRPAQPHWPDEWRQDQTLGEAFARSAVWYYQDLALEIGAGTYRDMLSRWRYGNADVPDDSDTFWLDGTLRISLDGQVSFLKHLVMGELDIRPETVAALDQASLAAAGQGWTLHGKTGIGPEDYSDWDGAFSGWYVGYVRREDQAPLVFALHASGPTFEAIAAFRRPFALDLLASAGLMEPQGQEEARYADRGRASYVLHDCCAASAR